MKTKILAAESNRERKSERACGWFGLEPLESRCLLSAVAVDMPIHLLTKAQSVVVAGDKALYFDAFGETVASGGVFDPASSQFTSVDLPASMVAGNGNGCLKNVTTLGNKTFFAGGYDASRVHQGYVNSTIDTVNIFDQSMQQWTTATLSQRRDGVKAFTVGDKAIFAGGYPGEAFPSDVVDIYDGSTNQWTTSHLSQPSYRLATAVLGHQAYLISSGNSDFPIDVFTAGHSSWSTLSIPKPIYVDSITAVGNQLVLFGSTYQVTGGKSQPTDHVIAEVYNTRSGRWSCKDFGKTGFNPNAGVIGHQAVFLGGVITREFGGGDNFTRIARVYHADTGKWSRTLPKEGISSDATISVALPDRLVFARNEVLNVYDPATGRWSWTATPIEVSYKAAIQAVGDEVVVYDGAQIHRIKFVGQRTVNPPVVTNPQNDVSTKHASFSWTSTPGARGYDVLIDGQYYGFATVNFWSSGSLVLTPGKHQIRVTAVGFDFGLDGPTSGFSVSN